MKVIVPCAGRSSRFPNLPPKWMLPDNEGVPMVRKAVSGLGVAKTDLIFTILREHEDRFQARAGLKAAFGQEVNCVILDEPTRSQSETVAETIKRTGLTTPFIVKDSDNYFDLPYLSQDYNYVCVASLSSFTQVNPQNKSYVQVDQEELIINFREKQVISDLFSVGGYAFTSPEDFLKAYNDLSENSRLSSGELYLSEIIAYMILNKAPFKIRRIENYQDWGTIHEWRSYLQRRRVIFVSVDGFLFEQGSPYFKPSFEDVNSHPLAIEAVKKLASEGQKFIYLSIRHQSLEMLTREQIRAQALPEAPILFGCDLSQWALLTAPHPNQPFRTSNAFELAPDDPHIVEKLEIES